MFCSSCGAKNDAGAKFCNGCGKPMGVSQAGSDGAQSNPAPAAQVNKCPACRAPIESFQTRCSSCGTELNSAQSSESVANFFKKLDEITQKEYEADKQREKETGKKRRKQSTPLKVLEIIAVLSFILMILHITGISNMITGADQFSIQIINESAADESVTVYVFDNDLNQIEFHRLQGDHYIEIPLYVNSYLVRITDNSGNDFHFPFSGEPGFMSGRIVLRFDGEYLFFE